MCSEGIILNYAWERLPKFAAYLKARHMLVGSSGVTLTFSERIWRPETLVLAHTRLNHPTTRASSNLWNLQAHRRHETCQSVHRGNVSRNQEEGHFPARSLTQWNDSGTCQVNWLLTFFTAEYVKTLRLQDSTINLPHLDLYTRMISFLK